MFNNSNLYEKNDDGKVYCGKNIMLSIINLSAKEISGVASLCTNFASRFKRFFSNNYFEGVKVSYTQSVFKRGVSKILINFPLLFYDKGLFM